MDDCSRCQRTTPALAECAECHEAFCRSHRGPTDHGCSAVRSGDGDGAARPTGDPTVLYSDHDGTSTDDEDDDPPGSDEDGDGDGLAPMDFDPTLGIDRLLRTAVVVVVVLIVGFGAGGFLWLGPGGDPVPGTDGAASPTGGADGEALNTTRVERLVHEGINRERRDAGVAPLEYDVELASISESHSRDMGERGYVGHTSPDGETTADRYREFGYACEATGEVLQWLDYGGIDGNGEAALARAVVRNWMGSDRHRSFVLNGSWSRQGVGVYLAGSGRVYVTQNTCAGASG